MKYIICILLIFPLLSNQAVRKRNLSYLIITSNSDLIVIGKIKDFTDKKYTFLPSEFIKGTSESTIKVEMFEEWSCDRRIKKPEIDQELFLFLNKKENGNYEILNGSNGEIFIDQSEISTFSSEDSIQLYSLQVFKEAIEMIIESIRYVGKSYSSYNEEAYYKRKVEQYKIDDFRKKNRFYKKITGSGQFN